MKKTVSWILFLLAVLVLGYFFLHEQAIDVPAVIAPHVNPWTTLSSNDITSKLYTEQWALYLASLELTETPDLCALVEEKNIEIIEHISLANNQLTDVTLDLSCFWSLKTLDLWFNKLTTIDGLILPALTKLKLNNNNFSSIKVPSITTLTSFDIAYNELETLDLTTLPSLKELQVQHNNLTELTGVETLTSLKRIKMEFNTLNDISFLDNLEELELVTAKNNNLPESDLLQFVDMNAAFVEKETARLELSE